MNMRRLFAFIALSALWSCGAPSGVSKLRDQMSQREKDSILAESKLPGSGVVRKAMSVSDAQQRRAAVYDSASAQN
jgi:hypothetical protein